MCKNWKLVETFPEATAIAWSVNFDWKLSSNLNLKWKLWSRGIEILHELHQGCFAILGIVNLLKGVTNLSILTVFSKSLPFCLPASHLLGFKATPTRAFILRNSSSAKTKLISKVSQTSLLVPLDYLCSLRSMNFPSGEVSRTWKRRLFNWIVLKLQDRFKNTREENAAVDCAVEQTAFLCQSSLSDKLRMAFLRKSTNQYQLSSRL